jgi:hypothetical protein
MKKTLHTTNINSKSKVINIINDFIKLKSPLIIKIDEDSISIKKPTRTLEQNAKMWAMLGDISKQCKHFNDYYSAEDWKDIFTASLSNELKMVPTIDNTRWVVLGLKTRKMNKQQLIELIEFIQAYGDLNGVKWSDYEQV